MVETFEGTNGQASNSSEDAVRDYAINGEIRWAINVLLEKIAAKFDDWDTHDIWKSEAASTVRSFKHAPCPQENEHEPTI